jgi:hypothetical protein
LGRESPKRDGEGADKDGTNEKESENTFYLVFEVYHNLYVLV